MMMKIRIIINMFNGDDHEDDRLYKMMTIHNDIDEELKMLMMMMMVNQRLIKMRR